MKHGSIGGQFGFIDSPHDEAIGCLDGKLFDAKRDMIGKRIRLRKLALLLAAAGGGLFVAVMAAATFFRRSEALGSSPLAAAGAVVLGASLALYLAALILERSWSAGRLRFSGLAALHAGLLAVIAGFLLNEVWGEKGFVYIREDGSAQTYVDDEGRDQPLPFPIRCTDFRLTVYPGTLRPSSYESDLIFGEGEEKKIIRLSINQPAVYGGYEFYQQDYGIEPGTNPRIEAQVQIGSEKLPLVMHIGEAQVLPDGRRLAIVDFSPALAFKNGQAVTLSNDAMLRPGYLAELVDPRRPEEPKLQWVLPSDPLSASIDDLQLSIVDFHGIEYTVLSLARRPFDVLCYVGFALCGIGMLLMMRGLAQKRKAAKIHLKEEDPA